MDDLLSPIREAEREAEETIKQARIASKEKIAEAEANARAETVESQEEDQLQYNQRLKRFESEGQREADKIRKSVDETKKALIGKAGARIDEGAKKILERIISEWQ